MKSLNSQHQTFHFQRTFGAIIMQADEIVFFKEKEDFVVKRRYLGSTGCGRLCFRKKLLDWLIIFALPFQVF
jgi:hypothetical protein